MRLVSPSEVMTPAASAPAIARPSRLIAEALVQRHGPRRIVDRATRLGLPLQLTKAMVAACAATAVDSQSAKSRLTSPTTSR